MIADSSAQKCSSKHLLLAAGIQCASTSNFDGCSNFVSMSSGCGDGTCVSLTYLVCVALQSIQSHQYLHQLHTNDTLSTSTLNFVTLVT